MVSDGAFAHGYFVRPTVIECTDPLTTIDIPNLVRETGDTLEASSRKGRLLTFRIRKS